jgi:Flp pilus assembly pilin Flp
MRNLIKKLRKNTKGQTALEYALVVGAISLVIMTAWNVVGDQVKTAIETSLASDIQKNLVDGNAAVPQ